MIIVLDKAGKAQLEDSGNFKNFKILAPAGQADAGNVAILLGPLGSPDDNGTHIWVSIPVFLERFGSDRAKEWHESFHQMIDSVAKYGLLNADRSAVRSHIETV